MNPGPDTTILAAFAVGFVSFISPCVLPLVPGYLSAISGVTPNDLREGDGRSVRVLAPALVFCLSFTLMFVALGMTATSLGSFLTDEKRLLEQLAGGAIVLMGLLFVATPFVPKLNREWRPDVLVQRAGTGGPIIAGLAFAVAWTPCIGPTLAAILATASTADSVSKGGVLLAFYSLGLAVPFLVTAVAFDRATTAFRWMRDRYLVITAVSGVVLIIMGTLILTGEMQQLNVKAQGWLDGLGLDFLYRI